MPKLSLSSAPDAVYLAFASVRSLVVLNSNQEDDDDQQHINQGN